MKQYLICIDSDGCAIDSMEVKHRQCFGPCLIEVWHLEPWASEILKRWNDINLYAMTRGINRFLGLEAILTEIDRSFRPIEGLDAYHRWCRTTASYSNAMIEREILTGNHPVFQKVLDWSQAVNRRVVEIAGDIHPFPGVKRALRLMKLYAHIAIVSSANPQAVVDEWTRFGFISDVDYVMSQDEGTKSECIGRLLRQGYATEHVLMIGDAPGDARAAAENNVLFYPILAGQEVASWTLLADEALPRLFTGQYHPAYQQRLLTQFHRRLGGKPDRP
ncbi:MAG: HAD family hydrolase [Aristaeellaceae bacterium]